MVHKITLKHIGLNNNSIYYNSQPLNPSDSILVSPGDELLFYAEGADWRITILIADGDFNHTDTVVKENNKLVITISSVPKSLTIFEAVCQLCPLSPLDAPKRIILASVKMSSPQIINAVDQQTDRINSLKKII